MRKMKALALVLALATLAACAQSPGLIRASSKSVRSDVFAEVARGSAAPKGFADLEISASLKTHNPGIYSAKDPHGTPRYQLRLSLDGQSVQFPGTLLQEGDGVRYDFSRNLRLKARPYDLIVALPGDGVAVEKKISLAEGEVNQLVVEPIYGRISEKKRPSAYRTTSFQEGIRGIELTLNGRRL